MSMELFMKELEYLLQDIPEEEKEDALQYYRDYFEEAGPDREKEVLEEFGSPERVAAMIRADIEGHLRDSGEFTDSGYQDERYREPNYQVAERFDMPAVLEKDETVSEQSPKTNKTLKVLLWIILVIVAAPVVLGLGGGAIGLLAGLGGCLIALAACGWLLTLCFLIAGIALTVWGIFQAFAEPWSGLLFAGIGLLFLGLGLLFLALSILFYGKLIPWLVRTVVDGVGRLIHRERRKTL